MKDESSTHQSLAHFMQKNQKSTISDEDRNYL